jgi:TM2 domain-containing membrane protein YozV
MTSPEMSPTPTCARCHRPIPEGQRLQHRGVIYCLECVGRSLNGDASSEKARRRSPGLAIILSLVPGLGQMYNGQMFKGVVVLVAFLTLASGGGPLGMWDHSGLNTAFLVTLYFWNLFDAYWTAQRINRAELPGVLSYSAPSAQSSAAPAWGVLLIVLGFLFLLNNFGVTWLTWDRVWPMAILALGVWLLVSFALSRRVTLPSQGEPPSQPPWAATASSAPTAAAQAPSAADAVSQAPSALEQTAAEPKPGEPSPAEPASPEPPPEEVNHG